MKFRANTKFPLTTMYPIKNHTHTHFEPQFAQRVLPRTRPVAGYTPKMERCIPVTSL